jgi:orotate phosphoribosyltransferase
MCLAVQYDDGVEMGHWDILKEMIRVRSFQQKEEPHFVLSSGNKSRFYFNLKKVSTTPEGMYHIGHVVLHKIKELGLRPKAIGGLTMGADPIAMSTAMTSYLSDASNAMQCFMIRKEAKGHGLGLQIEGDVKAHDDVIIVDDVVTTGASTIKAIDVARDYGLHIMAVIVLVDRCEENGSENIEARGVEVHSIYTIHDFI